MVPSWHQANMAIWTLGLLLQVALVVLVARTHIPSTLPGFTALIAFYPLRSVLLFAFSHRIAPDALETWSSVLDVLALLLQFWVAVELVLQLTRPMRARTRRWPLIPIGLGVFALASTWLTLALVPGRIEVDRTDVFFCWVMLALAVAAVAWSRSPNLLRICAGFALFSLFQLLALAARAHAWTARNRHAYVASEYAPALAWLVVVAYWLLSLKREERRLPQPTAVPG
jgi:hypothetical protein